MREKIIGIIALSGILFQFLLVGFLGYMFWLGFVTTDAMNEMLLGVLTGLATGIGLSNVVNYALDKTKEEKNI